MILLTVTVHDRSGILFKGDAKAVSSRNEKGPFDILPEHAIFLTLIEKEVTIHLLTSKKTFALKRGILSNNDNEVTILLGITSSL